MFDVELLGVQISGQEIAIKHGFLRNASDSPWRSGGGGGVGTSEVWVAEHRRYHHFSEMEVNTNSYDKLKVLTHTTGLYNKEICKLKEECKNI